MHHLSSLCIVNKYQTTEDLTDIKPFSKVKDSAKYGKELREKVWNRN